MDIANTLAYGWPGAQFSLNGNEYSGLNWLDKNQPKPTLEEIEAKYIEYQATDHRPLLDRLTDVLTQIPDGQAGAYAPLVGAVEPQIKRGRIKDLRAMIQGATLVDPSHQPIKDALLAEIDKELN